MERPRSDRRPHDRTRRAITRRNHAGPAMETACSRIWVTTDLARLASLIVPIRGFLHSDEVDMGRRWLHRRAVPSSAHWRCRRASSRTTTISKTNDEYPGPGRHAVGRSTREGENSSHSQQYSATARHCRCRPPPGRRCAARPKLPFRSSPQRPAVLGTAMMPTKPRTTQPWSASSMTNRHRLVAIQGDRQQPITFVSCSRDRRLCRDAVRSAERERCHPFCCPPYRRAAAAPANAPVRRSAPPEPGPFI